MKTGRLWINKKVDAGSGFALAVMQVLPFNATLEQWFMNFQSLPVFTDKIIITKISALGLVYNIDLIQREAATMGGKNIICTEKWEFKKGDSLSVFFANQDNIGVSFECVFSEK